MFRCKGNFWPDQYLILIFFVLKLIQDSMKIDEEEDDKGEKCESNNSGVEEIVKDSTPNPLEKYMKIIQQRREQELAHEVIILKRGPQSISIFFF